MLGRPRRVALLAEQCFHPRDAKTAVGILRYRAPEVAAVIDSTRAGSTAQQCVGCGGAVPVVGDLDAAVRAGADSLLLGIAPQGGGLPEQWRDVVRRALELGLDVISGLHVFLGDDPELARVARAHGALLLDVRRPPAERPIAARRAAALEALVVLTVGSDCNVGKMTAALELERELRARGRRVAFVATGQTGIMIADHGVAIDAVAADFAAGVIERLVLEAARRADIVLVEGQGALHHPGYSGVALSLLHGACPAALVLCHWEGRTELRMAEGEVFPMPPLREVRAAAEQAAAWVRPAATVAAALNTVDLEEPAAREACARRARELGVPAGDPVRFGAGPLADALIEARERLRPGGSGRGSRPRGRRRGSAPAAKESP